MTGHWRTHSDWRTPLAPYDYPIARVVELPSRPLPLEFEDLELPTRSLPLEFADCRRHCDLHARRPNKATLYERLSRNRYDHIHILAPAPRPPAAPPPPNHPLHPFSFSPQPRRSFRVPPPLPRKPHPPSDSPGRHRFRIIQNNVGDMRNTPGTILDILA